MKYFWLHVVHHSSYFMFENFIRNKILEKNFTEFGVVPPNCGILDQLLNLSVALVSSYKMAMANYTYMTRAIRLIIL